MTAADRVGRRVAIASIFVSACLATLKILVGLRAGSTAVVSDGIESAGDMLASGLVLFGLIMAAKPPDAEHPYGHGRVETLSGLAVGVLLSATGALICYHALLHALEGGPVPLSFAIWPLFVSIGVKSVLWWFKRVYGRRIRSDAMIADAWNDAVDTLSGMTALTGIGLALSAGGRFAAADAYGGFAVGLIVVFLGLHVIRDTTLQLMDTMPGREMLNDVREVALTVPGAMAIEKCFARKTGLRYHVDLHLEVDPAMTVMTSHDIASQVRSRIRSELEWVADVLVHVEPYGLDDQGE